MEEDKSDLRCLKYSHSWTWQLEDPSRHFQKKEGAEKQKTGRKMEVGDQAQTVLTLGLDQITKFVYRLDEPLGEGNV